MIRARNVFINRSAKKFYIFVRLLLYFECLSKADSIRIEIHCSPLDLKNLQKLPVMLRSG